MPQVIERILSLFFLTTLSKRDLHIEVGHAEAKIATPQPTNLNSNKHVERKANKRTLLSKEHKSIEAGQ